jgi:hypothetical protein
MKLTFDTEVDTYESALTALRAAYGRLENAAGQAEATPGGEVPAADGDEAYLPGRWSRRKLRKLAEWLDGSYAGIAVRYIAEHAPAVPIDQTIEHLASQVDAEIDGRQMGGIMSSVGFARNHIGGTTQPVYETDYGSRKYRMSPDIAKVLLEEMDAIATAA